VIIGDINVVKVVICYAGEGLEPSLTLVKVKRLTN